MIGFWKGGWGRVQSRKKKVAIIVFFHNDVFNSTTSTPFSISVVFSPCSPSWNWDCSWKNWGKTENAEKTRKNQKREIFENVEKNARIENAGATQNAGKVKPQSDGMPNSSMIHPLQL